jgi:hypothetical protein
MVYRELLVYKEQQVLKEYKGELALRVIQEQLGLADL